MSNLHLIAEFNLTWVLVGLLVLLVIWFIGLYNGLVRLKNVAKEAWAQIDVQLKRRHDLIPNLVETAKGYMKHEAGTLEAVIKARQTAVQVTADPNAGPAAVAKAENALASVMKQFMMLTENSLRNGSCSCKVLRICAGQFFSSSGIFAIDASFSKNA